MTHKHLNHLSANALNFEIAGSKQCLANHGYNVTSFAYPYDEGSDNVTVVDAVAKNYQLARSGSEPLMFLYTAMDLRTILRQTVEHIYLMAG
jgi:hypothetical protein